MTVWEARQAIESSITVQDLVGVSCGIIITVVIVAFFSTQEKKK